MKKVVANEVIEPSASVTFRPMISSPGVKFVNVYVDLPTEQFLSSSCAGVTPFSLFSVSAKGSGRESRVKTTVQSAVYTHARWLCSAAHMCVVVIV